MSPTCSSNFIDDEDPAVDESDILMPTEFRSIGDVSFFVQCSEKLCWLGRLIDY